jgi:hypothetical protein
MKAKASRKDKETVSRAEKTFRPQQRDANDRIDRCIIFAAYHLYVGAVMMFGHSDTCSLWTQRERTSKRNKVHRSKTCDALMVQRRQRNKSTSKTTNRTQDLSKKKGHLPCVDAIPDCHCRVINERNFLTYHCAIIPSFLWLSMLRVQNPRT